MNFVMNTPRRHVRLASERLSQNYKNLSNEEIVEICELLKTSQPQIRELFAQHSYTHSRGMQKYQISTSIQGLQHAYSARCSVRDLRPIPWYYVKPMLNSNPISHGMKKLVEIWLAKEIIQYDCDKSDILGLEYVKCPHYILGSQYARSDILVDILYPFDL